MASKVDCVVSAADILGEVPIWCDRGKQLWWVDVLRPSLQSYNPVTGQHHVYLIPGPCCGSWSHREKGGTIVALRDGIYTFEPTTGQLELLVLLEDKEQNRLNDGKCDRRGRFWVGSMNQLYSPNQVAGADGTLYRVGSDLTVHSVLDDFTIPNSIAFSPDDRTMYFADTRKSTIWAFDFDIDSGEISNRRVFVDNHHNAGHPDGSTVDADGCLWNAEYLGSRVVRYTPDGRVDRVVELPVRGTTSCAFGGDKLDILFVTSAALRAEPKVRAAEPYAGGLFAIDVGVRGLPEPRFAG